MNQQTIDMLTEMKMTAMAAEFANQIQDASFNSLGFEERLSMLVTAEWNRRQNNKVTRLMRNAEFGIPSAVMEEIEYHEDRKLDKAQLLRLAACNYIDEGHHVVLEGASGNGKTYIACALGNAACRRMKTVRYIRMPELLDELNIARSNGSLKKLMKAYKKAELLILDEWLIRPLTSQESYDLLDLAAAVLRSFVRSTSPKAGIPGLIRTRSLRARFLKQSWTELFIIRMRSWLKAVFRCANARGFEQLLWRIIRRMHNYFSGMQ